MCRKLCAIAYGEAFGHQQKHFYVTGEWNELVLVAAGRACARQRTRTLPDYRERISRLQALGDALLGLAGYNRWVRQAAIAAVTATTAGAAVSAPGPPLQRSPSHAQYCTFTSYVPDRKMQFFELSSAGR